MATVTEIFAISSCRVSCPTCGNQMPPMERPPAFSDCPECERLIGLGVDLNKLTPRS